MHLARLGHQLITVYPLFFSASWYGGTASWKTSSSEDISDSLLFTDSGMFFIMLGGWFDFLCTYTKPTQISQSDAISA